MKSNENASLQILKITIVTLIFIFTFSIVVRATSTNINNVKIVLSNNYEMDVVTTKTKISDILKENHIIVLPNQTVFPKEDSELGENRVIKISTVDSDESKIIELANSEEKISLEQVLGNYSTIVEKIEIVEETIPYETITKENSSISSSDRTNKVIQEGTDGLKRVTYRVKYQNDIEISREKVKEEIIRDAVNKIIQVTKTTSRDSGGTTRTGGTDIAASASAKYTLASKVEGITPIIKTLNTSAYTASTCDKAPTDKNYGITASGAKAKANYTVAAGKGYPMGTIIYIPAMANKPSGGWYVVQDRGGAITNNKLDIYMNTYNECIQFGRRNLECYIYVK